MSDNAAGNKLLAHAASHASAAAASGSAAAPTASTIAAANAAAVATTPNVTERVAVHVDSASRRLVAFHDFEQQEQYSSAIPDLQLATNGSSVAEKAHSRTSTTGLQGCCSTHTGIDYELYCNIDTKK